MMLLRGVGSISASVGPEYLPLSQQLFTQLDTTGDGWSDARKEGWDLLLRELSGEFNPAMNIIGKFKALYPMKGGTYTAQRWNGLNPVDSDAAFRLTFIGSPTFTDDGMTGTASGYANTHIVPSTHLSLTSASNGANILTNMATSLSGVIGDGANMRFIPNYSGFTYSMMFANVDGAGRVRITNGGADIRGINIASQTGAAHFIMRNGTTLVSSASTGGSLPATPILIGENGLKVNTAFIADGLTSAEALFLSDKLAAWSIL